VIELTPEEKIAMLKEQLEKGEMGPAKFDEQFQPIWMQMVDERNASAGGGMPTSRPSLRRGATRSTLDVNVD